MRGRVNVDDLELIAWFPELVTRDEKAIHRAHKAQRTGEWYPEEAARKILAELRSLWPDEASSCDLAAAKATRRRL